MVFWMVEFVGWFFWGGDIFQYLVVEVVEPTHVEKISATSHVGSIFPKVLGHHRVF